MLKFDVYTKTDGEVSVETLTFEPTDYTGIGELKDMSRKASVVVAPADVDGAAALMTAKGRTLDWSVEMLTTVLELASNGTPVPAIKFEVYSKHGEMVNDDAVRKTVRGEANTHQDVPAELRAAATAAAPAKGEGRGGGKSTLSDEDKATIIERIANGETGSAVAKDYGVSSSTANTLYRKQHGYRKATA